MADRESAREGISRAANASGDKEQRCESLAHTFKLHDRSESSKSFCPLSTRFGHRSIADIRRLRHFNAMRLPIGSMREFRRALDDAHPRWAKSYLWVVGVPAWAYLAYRTFTADALELRTLDEVAIIAFLSASAVSIAVLFRAFWRNDI